MSINTYKSDILGQNYISYEARQYLENMIEEFKANDPYAKKDHYLDFKSYITDTEIYIHDIGFDEDIFVNGTIGEHLDMLFDVLDQYENAWKLTLDCSSFCIINLPRNLIKFTSLHYLFIQIRRDSIPPKTEDLIPSTVANLVLVGYGDCDLSSLYNLEYVVISGKFITPVKMLPKIKTIIRFELDGYHEEDHEISQEWKERIKRENIHYDYTHHSGCFY